MGAYLGTHVSPNDFAFPAFLGLAYPYLLLASIIFAVLWLFVKKWFALISIGTILLGANHLRHYFVITVSEPKIEEPVKIMSYNVHVFDFFDLDNRLDNRNRIFQFLEKEDPAIICFQEFFHHEGTKDFVTRDTLIEFLDVPYYHEHYTHDMAFQRYFGTVTFSKFPIVGMGEIAFDNDPNNFCIYSDIDINGHIIRVFNGHLGSIRFQNKDYDFFGGGGAGKYMKDGEEGTKIYDRLKIAFQKRAVQVEKVVKEIDRSPYPVVICVDLNDTPISYSYRQFGSRLEDAFMISGNGFGSTYQGKMPSNRIDYIFHDEDILSTAYKTHAVHFSDHKPISCLIGFE